MTALVATLMWRNRRACRCERMSDKFQLSDVFTDPAKTSGVIAVTALGSLERPAGRRFSRSFGLGSMDSGPRIAGPPTLNPWTPSSSLRSRIGAEPPTFAPKSERCQRLSASTRRRLSAQAPPTSNPPKRRARRWRRHSSMPASSSDSRTKSTDVRENPLNYGRRKPLCFNETESIELK